MEETDLENRLFEFTMRVLRGDGSELPEDVRGAYVPCYASAPDYRAALKKGALAANAMHNRFDDVRGEVREIPLATWGAYVAQVWPDFSGHFPSQDELPGLVANGIVFFGPIATFKG